MFLVIHKKTLVTISFVVFSFIMISSFVYLQASTRDNDLDLLPIITSEYKNQKVAFLTFDDGPTNLITPKVLDVLDKYDIKGNFFILGKMAEENPDVIKRIYEDGHYIGNHGYSHNNEKMYANSESFLKELTQTDKIIGEILEIEDYKSKVFRFPNGYASSMYKTQKQKALEILRKQDYKYIDWNSLTNDSLIKTTRENLFNVFKKTSKDKDVLVVLMHDTGDLNKTYDVLEDCIIYLIEQGYAFKTLERMR